MLKLMSAYLRMTGNHYCDDGRDFQDCEKILDMMEKAGMEPPEIRCGGRTSDDNGYDNQWEEED